MRTYVTWRASLRMRVSLRNGNRNSRADERNKQEDEKVS